MKSELFNIFGLSVHAYGLMLSIAFLVGIIGISREARRYNLTTDNIVDLATWILIGAVVGARLVYVLTEIKFFLTRPWWETLMINSGGLAFHGGLLGGFLAGFLFTKLKKIHPWKLADIVAPFIALGYAIVRLGCFLNGCCYGKVSHLPWAVRCSAQDALLRHPTQLYSMLGSLIIFLILYRLRNHQQFAGFLFLLYIGLYGIMRFIVEIFRESPMVFPWLSIAQLVCIFMFLSSFTAIFFIKQHYHSKEATADAVSEFPG